MSDDAAQAIIAKVNRIAQVTRDQGVEPTDLIMTAEGFAMLQGMPLMRKLRTHIIPRQNRAERRKAMRRKS